jgi:FMN phosphatase YigB (HAD superfamily)
VTTTKDRSALPLDAVTFDYWETLCTDPLSNLTQRRIVAMHAAVAAHGIELPLDRFDTAHARAWEVWNGKWETNDHVDWRFVAAVALGEFATELPVGSSAYEAATQAFFDATADPGLVLVDGIADALTALAARDIRIGIICDVGLIPSFALRKELERLGVLDRFDHWSFSDEVGVYKPDARIFEHALAGLGGIDARRAAHIGDRRRTDVAGARGMGMRSVRINATYDDTNVADGADADAVISTHRDLLPALGLTD